MILCCSLQMCLHIRTKGFLNSKLVLKSLEKVIVTDNFYHRQLVMFTEPQFCNLWLACRTHKSHAFQCSLNADHLFFWDKCVHVYTSRQEFQCFLRSRKQQFSPQPGLSTWPTTLFAALLGNKRGWQLLKLPPTPPADTQSLLLMQYNLFILLKPLFQFRCQDCVWASSHENCKN